MADRRARMARVHCPAWKTARIRIRRDRRWTRDHCGAARTESARIDYTRQHRARGRWRRIRRPLPEDAECGCRTHVDRAVARTSGCRALRGRDHAQEALVGRARGWLADMELERHARA